MFSFVDISRQIVRSHILWLKWLSVAEVLSMLACSREEMQFFTVQGTVRAKKKGPVPPNKEV